MLSGVAPIFRVHLVLGMTIFPYLPVHPLGACGAHRLSTLPVGIRW